MGPSIIARNYAETLLELARRSSGDAAVEGYGDALDQVAQLLRQEPRIRHFLETPRVTTEDRKRVVRDTFGGKVPEPFLRFLLVVIEKRRQALLPQIAEAYATLVDEIGGRVRATVTLAQQADEGLQREIVATLEKRLGKKVSATFATDPAILGGLQVRVGDRLYDGSVRRRITGLRRRLLAAG